MCQLRKAGQMRRLTLNCHCRRCVAPVLQQDVAALLVEWTQEAGASWLSSLAALVFKFSNKKKEEKSIFFVFFFLFMGCFVSIVKEL